MLEFFCVFVGQRHRVKPALHQPAAEEAPTLPTNTTRVGFLPSAFNPDGTFEYDGFQREDFERLAGIELVALPDDHTIGPADFAGLDVYVNMPGAAAITRENLAGADRLALIANLGIGFENIDLPACTERGVALSLAVDAVKRPTALATIGMLLAVTQRLIIKHELTKQGADGWRKMAEYPGLTLEGRVLGIVGLGRIGQEVAKLAAPLGLKVIANDPYLDPAIAASLGVPLLALDELLAAADVVTIHVPLNAETRGLIDRGRLAKMRPSAFLLNLARGPVIDRDAVYDTLKSGRITGAGLDVFHQEPTAAGDPLLDLPNVTLSGHTLAVTDTQGAEVEEHVLAGIRALREGRMPAHVANEGELGAVWPRGR
jgi:phosphoglycerate dehydrogenase-like enzyme